MAKKRGGEGGSSMGLIITLVFFVLATIILGVTTYFGFADQEAKEKARADAVAKEKKREEERNWWRWQARVLRQYIEMPPAGLDAKDLAREKALFDKGQLTYAATQPEKDDVAKMMKELDKSMLWDANKEESPTKTFQTRLDDKDKQYTMLKQSMDALKIERDDFKTKMEEALGQVAKEKKMFDETILKVNESVKGDLAKLQSQLDAQQKDLDAKGKEKTAETQAKADAQQKLETTAKAKKVLEGRLATATKDNKEIRESLEETKERLNDLAALTNVDLKAKEAERLDARAREVLRGWTHNWQVVQMDRGGKSPYINLGSADGLTTQVTFSIHSLGLDGKLNPNPKGTMEVVRIAGPHMAQCRITSMKDDRKDPVLKGDRLFNPTWDPNRKRHVAIAGVADLGGDGTDGQEDFRRLLERQGVILDAYIDTKDDKQPRLMGKGIATTTDYLVLSEPLEEVPAVGKLRTKDYVQAYARIMTEMKAKANASGVTVIALRKYLDMIGYRSPKVSSSNPSAGYSR